jgi:hypothetical protein
MVRLRLVWDQPRRFRIKPREVEVFKVNADNLNAVAAWCRGKAYAQRDNLIPRVYVPAKIGIQVALLDWYVVKHSDGGFATYNSEEFERLFEPLTESVSNGE